MGLDAFVACNCLRDGKLSNPLEPFTMDLFFPFPDIGASDYTQKMRSGKREVL